MAAPRTVSGWIGELTRQFTQARLCHDNGLETAHYEAEYLVCHVLGISPEAVDPGQEVTRSQEARIRELMAGRLARTPVAYLTGEAFFGGRRFFVDERVLIPRSRIENLLCAPDILHREIPPARTRSILDLCTGSGCLAVCLALLYPEARVTATDLSRDALAVARINVAQAGVEGRVRLLESDLYAALAGETFDLVVSNPPYVPRATMARLPPEFCREPALALAGGKEGLDLVLPILRETPRHLTAGGALVLEVGDEVEATLRRRFPALPGEWIPFPFGASGVLLAHREALAGAAGRI